jgi:alkylation response protein AidB-like acyl-CoA dehydrogenase
MAVTDKPKGTKGISAFIVEKGNQGFRAGKKENKLGMRASDTSEVVFSDCFVPEANLLGKEGLGFVNTLQVLDGGRISIAALALGMAQGAYEAAAGYAKQRKQFGKAISEFQAIQFKLADMATKIQAARLLTNFAARKKDAGERADVECGMAKLFASETCFEVVGEALRVHGGYGFSKEYDVERLYRDAPLLIIGEGTNEIQRLIIAKGLLERHRLTG